MVKSFDCIIASNESMPLLLTPLSQLFSFQPILQSWSPSYLRSICKDVSTQLHDRLSQPWAWVRWPHDHFSLEVGGRLLDSHHHRAWRLSPRETSFLGHLQCSGIKLGWLWFLTACNQTMFLMALLLSFRNLYTVRQIHLLWGLYNCLTRI